jgi:hypothetical protein
MNRAITVFLLVALSVLPELSAQHVRNLGAAPTAQSLQRLAVGRPAQIEMQVPTLDGSLISMQLERVAWSAPWAKCIVMNDEGSTTTALADDVVMYRTKLLTPGADWTIIAIDKRGSMMGLTQQKGRRATLVRDASNALRLQTSAANAKPLHCQTSPEKISSAAMSALRQAGHKTSEETNANDTLTLELALEVDNDAVYAAGSVGDARLLVSLNMAAVSAVFETDLRTRVVVTNLRLWDKSNDPYPTQQDVFSLLDTFIEEYTSNMTSIQRDAAVFITSRDVAGGLAATIGGLCEPDGAYCAVDIETKAVAYPTWSWNVSVISHELGHICGGIHTHSCYWPNGALDSCVTPESGTCFSSDDVKPSRGTIMSYCFANGDPAFEDVLEFHPMHRLVLREYLQSSACVGNQPRQRSCSLVGTIRDVETGKPLGGVTLKIRPVSDYVYRGTPVPSGDTIVTSAADGTWNFAGLGRGLYAIDIDGPYTIYPAEVGEDAFSFGVAIADSIERKDILVTKGQIVEITIENDGDTTSTVLNVYSEKLPGLLSLVPVPFPEGTQTSVTVRRVLPLGRAVIVPSAIGRRFTPSSLRLDVSGETPQQSARLVSASVLPELTTTISMAIAEVIRIPDRRVRLLQGAPYQITESGTSKRYTGMTDADGIAVIENVDAAVLFEAEAQYDSSHVAPASNSGYLLPIYDETATVVMIQPRRRPLIARQYAFRTEAGEFRVLKSPTVLRDKLQFGRVVTPVALLFPITILDRTFDTMNVHTNGFISLGGSLFPLWASSPVLMWNDADLVISALGHYMTLDTNAPNGPRICWAVEGASPDRVLVVEWRSMTLSLFDANTGTYVDRGRVSFQIRLHEGGNIGMVYDTEIPIPQPVDVQVGIRGNDVLDNQVVRSGGSDDLLQSTAAFDPNGTVRLRLTPTRQFAKGTTLHWEMGTTGVDSESPSLLVGPNPTQDELRIQSVEPGSTIRVFSLHGQILRTRVAEADDVTLDVSSLPQGVYLATLVSNGYVVNRPFAIVR